MFLKNSLCYLQWLFHLTKNNPEVVILWFPFYEFNLRNSPYLLSVIDSTNSDKVSFVIKLFWNADSSGEPTSIPFLCCNVSTNWFAFISESTVPVSNQTVSSFNTLTSRLDSLRNALFKSVISNSPLSAKFKVFAFETTVWS